MLKKSLKINLIIPFKSLTGGIKVVLEYANQLTDLGHEVRIIYPLIPYYFGEKKFNFKDRWWQMRGLLANLIRGNRIQWFKLKAKLTRVPWIANHFLSDADIVVATAWPTAYSVSKFSNTKGRKFYFVQGYEIWQGPKDRIDASYRLPLHKIVIASWLKKFMQEKFGDVDVPLISNGVNLKEFYNENKQFNSPPRLLLMHHDLEIKGFKDALQAIKLVQDNHPDFKLVVFGAKSASDLPRDAEFHLKPMGEELRQLYCSCDIFISASWLEGCQLPPMEAMACQCAVVASHVGGIPDYAIAGETALVFEPKDIRAMADHIIYFLDHSEELKRISLAGYHHIKHFTWEKCAQKIESVFLNE
ncbi:glycosyltransferase family 4 protein [candidate division KSB1 bacterium]|nr:glycosyltransferase family 4 protein [candidate division KSB1 bacterium]